MILDDEFFARIGHDLRGELATMLTGIMYLLRYEKRLEAGPREMLERVRGAGERLKRLLEEFDHAIWLRADPSRPLLIGACDPAELVQRVASSFEAAAAARGVRVVVQDEIGEGVRSLQADEELLAVALGYVLGFAITRSRDRPVTLRLSQRDSALVVTVTDEAGGATPDVVAGLFEPFGERAAIAPDPARRKERLGLGLPIARGILEAHGGGITVGPAPAGAEGGGLSFTCTLGGFAPVSQGAPV